LLFRRCYLPPLFREKARMFNGLRILNENSGDCSTVFAARSRRVWQKGEDFRGLSDPFAANPLQMQQKAAPSPA
jgi:hypothetical protein